MERTKPTATHSKFPINGTFFSVLLLAMSMQIGGGMTATQIWFFQFCCFV